MYQGFKHQGEPKVNAFNRNEAHPTEPVKDKVV